MGSLRNVGVRTSQVMNWARIQAHCSRNLNNMQMEINGPSGRDMDTVDIRMAPPVPIVRPPIRSYCPLQAKLAGSKTTTWKRCWHLSCIDFGNGHHFSHSMLCPVNPAQRPYFCNQSPSPTEYPVDLLSVLTRMVRHRMRSRYGGSRGGRARPHTAQSSAPPSPPQDQEDEPQPRPQLRHYSYTRSRRGRGMESRDPLRDFGLHYVISQQSPGSASHTTHFRLHSHLNKPTITAKVTVVFTEEEMLDSDQVTSSKEHSQGMRAQDKRGVRRKIQRMIARESGIAECMVTMSM